jgi:hypothetical protein
MAFPALIARHLGFGRYNALIDRGLTKAYTDADRRSIDLASLRAVVLSDHHRGRGDGADDFRRCEPAYCAALGWYLEEGYELWLLGDVEELWENGSRDVLRRYRDVLELERAFGDRLHRFYGNHDMAWRDARLVARRLAAYAPAGGVREAVRIAITDGGEPLGKLFLVHGHQGTIDSGNLLVVPFSRLAVRFFWGTLQRSLGFASTSPSSDALLRGKHDGAMASWADKQPEALVMIAGHTHHPVFAGTEPPDLAAEAAAAKAAYERSVKSGSGAAAARADLELAEARVRRRQPYEPPALRRPSYFNTGCCSFGDGDVTGLELADGQIRLVRWLDDGGRATPHRLQQRDLREVFAAVAGAAPAPVGA